MPNYLISASDDAVILRNFEGQIVRYQSQDQPATIDPTNTRGVSALLQGTKSVLIPEGSERMIRRKRRAAQAAAEEQIAAKDLHADSDLRSGGCGSSGEDESSSLLAEPPLLSLGIRNGLRSEVESE